MANATDTVDRRDPPGPSGPERPRLVGTFEPPGDKSISHRLVLFSILARGSLAMEHTAPGQDVRSSLAAAATLGVTVKHDERRILLTGAQGRLPERIPIDCGNSGTSMRLLMGILAGLPGVFTLDGDASLHRRPMERLAVFLRRMGASVECTNGGAPVHIEGRPLIGTEHDLPVASAQMKSALLLAGISADGETTVREPAASRDHTERLLSQMGARIEAGNGGWIVRRSELELPGAMRVPGDPSSAAFFLSVAAALPGSRVTALGMMLNPTRTAFLDVLRDMGADIEVHHRDTYPEPWGDVIVTAPDVLRAAEIRASTIPSLVDEVPVLALIATQARGATVFHGAEELRHKETDRLAALVEELGRLGANVRVSGSDLVVTGPTRLSVSGGLDSRGDHRMAMTLRLAGLLADADPVIADESCQAISYPDFAADLERLRT